MSIFFTISAFHSRIVEIGQKIPRGLMLHFWKKILIAVVILLLFLIFLNGCIVGFFLRRLGLNWLLIQRNVPANIRISFQGSCRCQKVRISTWMKSWNVIKLVYLHVGSLVSRLLTFFFIFWLILIEKRSVHLWIQFKLLTLLLFKNLPKLIHFLFFLKCSIYCSFFGNLLCLCFKKNCWYAF